MSTLNFYQPDASRAVVVVDTAAGHGKHSAKLVPLMHWGAVVAQRGRGEVAAAVVSALMGYGGSTFDEGAEALPSIVEAARLFIDGRDRALAASLGVDVDEMHGRAFAGCQDEGHKLDEVLLVGYSDKAGGLDSILVKRHAPGQPVEVTRGLGLLIGPPCEPLHALAKSALETDQGALQFVRRQLENVPAGAPGFGGRVIVARLRAREVVVKDLGPAGCPAGPG